LRSLVTGFLPWQPRSSSMWQVDSTERLARLS